MKRRILITDDDRFLLTAYRALLGSEASLAIDFAQTPEQAHAFMESHDYDACCFDIELNDDDVSGFDLLREIKREHPATPVLMMSSLDDERTVSRCLALGADEFASKNANFLPSLARRVHGLLGPQPGVRVRAC